MYSENDMKEFFQNIVDQVATLSTQAARVSGLEQRITELSDRLNNLEQVNRQLQSDLGEARELVQKLVHEKAVTTGHLENEKAVTQALRETITQRDAGVVALETSFRQEQEAHRITTSERDDARQRNQELEQSLASSKQSYDDVFHDRDNWRQKFWDMEKEAAQVKQQLDKINSVLNPLRVVSGDVQAIG